MPKTAKTHDIFITATTKRGFMLARDAQNRPAFRVTSSPAIAPQYFIGAASYSNLSANEELVVASDSWHGGLGEEIFTNSKRYFDSYGVDARFASKLHLGGQFTNYTTLNADIHDYIANKGMEYWTDATHIDGWTSDSPSDLSKSSTAHGGSFAAGLNLAAGGMMLYHNMLVWSGYKGVSLTVTAWVKTAAANNGRLIIDDGVTAATYSSYHSGGGAWEQLTVTQTIHASATRVLVGVKQDAPGPVLVDDWGFTLPGVALAMGTTPVKFIEFNDALYYATTTDIWRWDNTNARWDRVYYGTGITDLEVLGNYLYCALGSAAAYLYSTDGLQWYLSTLSNNYFSYFKTVGLSLCGFKTPNEMRTATDPTNAGSWSAATSIGGTENDITGVDAYTSGRYVGKEDGLYQVNSAGTASALLPEFDSLRHANNMKKLRVWQSKAYLPTNWGGLWEYDDGVVTQISVAKYAPKVSTLAGRILDMVGDTEWLYCLVDAGTAAEILCGRWETIAGTTPETDWRWHSIAEFGGMNTPGCIHISTLYGTDPRLWCAGANDSTPKCGYMPLPVRYADIESDTGYLFPASGTVTLPYMNFGFADLNKPLLNVTLLSSGLTATLTVKIEYRRDATSTWTELVTLGASASPSTTTAFAEGISARKVQFRLTLVTVTPWTATPVIYGLVARARLPKRTLFEFVVRVADDIQMLTGQTDTTPMATLASFLSTANGLTAGATLTDLDGTTHTVNFVNMVDEYVIEEKSRKPERRFHITAAKVS